jgi:hypothetical protein
MTTVEEERSSRCPWTPLALYPRRIIAENRWNPPAIHGMKPEKVGRRSMAKEAKSSKTDMQDLLVQVDRFLASPASNEAVGISRESIDSAVASMEKAERIDLETLKLTVTA